MAVSQGSYITCPGCGEENIRGTDRCENCLYPLRSTDVPDAYQPVSESALTATLAEIRLHKPATVGPTTTVREAVQLLRENPSGAVLVVEGTRAVGIFTERDVLRKIAGRPDRIDDPVAAYMTPDPVVLRESDTIAVAFNKMGDGGFRHIPLVNDTGVVGMITATALMAWLLQKYID
ncbi:MAG: hypothetical protein Kow0010_25020 [Dehalococcoidia bacterium]